MPGNTLPIQTVRREIIQALETNRRVVITAPTGAGKSTQVPQFIIDDCPRTGRVLILQPRRLAAFMLAERVAQERGGQLGEEVGVITRFERRVSDQTRLIYITEGVLLRRFLSDPDLTDVGTVIFDEFHERSLHADVALALVRLLQERRPDLQVVVMSATLAHDALREYLAPCPYVHAEGRLFPVDITCLSRPFRGDVWDAAAGSLSEILSHDPCGDVLVFMPGLYEIQQTLNAFRRVRGGERILLLPLYGDLDRDAQYTVMRPADRRKVIVATNIAETSLTIPGVAHVIDSGLARINQYDAGRGINMLTTVPVSRDSADQRAGRAGRERPGTCHRLWTEAEHFRKELHAVPEIQRLDLAEIVLLLIGLGVRDIARFPWFEPPRETAVSAAVDLLEKLQAFDARQGCLTPLGLDLLNVPLHPRLAMLCRAAVKQKVCGAAAEIAAMLSERPFLLRGQGTGTRTRTDMDSPCSDLLYELRLFHEVARHSFSVAVGRDLGVSSANARQVARTATYLADVLKRIGWLQDADTPIAAEPLARCLLAAFPDRLACRRDRGTLVCQLADGRHAELARESVVRSASSPLLTAAEIREIPGGRDDRMPLLSRATEVQESWLREMFPDAWIERDELVWDAGKRRVWRRRGTSCLGVILNETLTGDVPDEAAAALLAEKIREESLPLAGWNRDVDGWIERVRWLAGLYPEKGLLTYDDDDMAVIMREFCAGHKSYSEVKKKAILPFVQHAMAWSDIQFVEEKAPKSIRLASGAAMRLSYDPKRGVLGRARIQDLYDQPVNPSVADGRARVLLEILAPNMRTVQITDDIGRFWSDIYPKAKQELSRRYPKHEWR